MKPEEEMLEVQLQISPDWAHKSRTRHAAWVWVREPNMAAEDAGHHEALWDLTGGEAVSGARLAA